VFLVAILLSVCCILTAHSNHRYQQRYSDTDFIKYIDTNIVVYNEQGVPLRYHQYASLILDGWHWVTIKNGRRQFIAANMGNSSRFKPMLLKANLNALSPKSKDIPQLSAGLIKHPPAGIDTNIIVYDQDNEPLRFHQYVSLLFNEMAYYNAVTGKNHLARFSEFLIMDKHFTLKTKADSSKKLAEVYLQFLQADSVLVIKSKRQVYLKRGGKTFLTFACNLGQNPVGDKQRDGDKKTPEGFYKLEGKTTQVKYYKGYWISYPDSAHILAAKQKGVLPGAGVMIHGTSASRAKLKDWTAGCIAISNARMDSLFKYVTPMTPIEIRK